MTTLDAIYRIPSQVQGHRCSIASNDSNGEVSYHADCSGFVVVCLWFGFGPFTYVIQGYFTNTGAIVSVN